MADSRSSGQPSTASSTAAGAAAPVSPQSLNSIAETEGPANSPISTTRPRGSTGGSSASRRIRAASIKLLESDVPAGAWAASSTAASKAPTLGEIRRGSYSQGIAGSGPQAERRRRSSATRESSGGDESPTLLRKLSRTSPNPGAERTSGRSSPAGRTTSAGAEAFPTVKEGETLQVPVEENEKANGIAAPQRSGLDGTLEGSRDQTGSDGIWENGYTPPPHLPWTTSTLIGLKAFWKWFITPSGFLITLYCLNVVAWGGMLFLLLVNAAPAMCRPTCDDLYSPRRIWLEIDSQILNALFCVTGLGLIPWRFRDLYWLMVYRLQHREEGIRRLAGIHRDWFRLKDSDMLDVRAANGNETVAVPDMDNPAIPLPVSKIPDPPLTGVRAPPTSTWKMDYVVWCNVWNTFFQICLCGFMWGLNRFDRPSWSTGLFIVLAMVIAALGGIMMFIEGKKVKRVEGVPPKVEATIRDVEKSMGTGRHDNNPSNGAATAGISDVAKVPAGRVQPLS